MKVNWINVKGWGVWYINGRGVLIGGYYLC